MYQLLIKLNYKVLSVIFALSIMCLFIIFPTSVFALDDYPRRPILIICSWNTGGGSDVMSRTTASILEDFVDVSVPVTNVPGGSGAAGLSEMLARDADGYTMLNFIKSTFGMTVRKEISGKMNEDWIPLARMNNARNWLFVHPDAQWENAEELLDYIRENPNEIVMSGESEVSDDALIRDRWAKEEGLKIRTDWFESASRRQTSVVGGHNDVLNDQMGSGTVHEFVKADKLRPIMVFADERDERFPDVQCSKEVGLEGYDHYTQWRGFIIRAETPKERIDFLENKLEEVANTNEFQEYLEQYYLEPDSYMDSKDFTKFLKKQMEEQEKM